MADLAAHLVDEVLPTMAIRQWVCSLPWRLRVPLAYDRELGADVLGAFVGALRRSLRWRGKRARRTMSNSVSGSTGLTRKRVAPMRSST